MTVDLKAKCPTRYDKTQTIQLKVKKIKDLKSLTEYQLWQKKKKKMKACENKTKKQ